MAIEPESSTERKKLADVLEMMKRQDPTFRAQENEETGQTLISGMGELHLEVIKHRLLRDYNLNVRVHKPRVSYRETVEHAAEVVGECHRQQAGQTLFAKVRIRMEPFAKGTVPRGHRRRGVTESLPEAYLTAVLDVLNEQGQGGGLLGCPLMKVKITVLGGEVHETETQRDGLPHGGRRRLQQGLAGRRHRAAGADHEAANHHARGKPGRLHQRPAAAAGRDYPHPGPRAATRSSKPRPRWPTCSAIPAPCGA